MEFDKMLRHVNNLNDYISVMQDLAKHPKNNSKVPFNMSTVLLLKKVRSLEIEYFNKCQGNGAALILFERMVEQPASKTWGLLGKELVSLLQYWLDAMRKHLISHSHHWWTFLKLLLKFIKCIRGKDPSLPDTLVEGTAECLLDLATSSQPDILQRYEILCCFNLCCAESSREIRFALKNKFECYFVKLALLLSSCGQLPAQYSALEALLRWLLPRHAPQVRKDAAKKWFPEERVGKKALELFLDRPWQNFFQDARDFLNAVNEGGALVASARCRKLSVGGVAVVLGSEKRETWLDVNSSDRSLSVVLDPRLLDALQMSDVTTWETLHVTEDNTISVQLFRESSEVTLVVHTVQPPLLIPSSDTICNECEVRAVVSSAADLYRLDTALRDAFSHKYQMLLDLDKAMALSPQQKINNEKAHSSLEEDSRFSHPPEVPRRKHSGFMVRQRNPVSWNSPSTASTSSLAQLHEKLASLPQYKYEKVAVHISAQPELSTVSEVSETEERQSFLTSQTLTINRHFGICQKKFKTSDRNSQSDGELQNKTKVGRYLSPVAKEDEHSTSCLLVATIGSADESVINDTLERLTKNKDFNADNIVDLLVQEALQKDFNDKELLDSGINTGNNNKTSQEISSEAVEEVYKDIAEDIHSEAIENTPLEKQVAGGLRSKENEKVCTVISNTTTDESNDVVYETPMHFVNSRKRNLKTNVMKKKPDLIEPNDTEIFDVDAVEQFFSQHIAENKRGEVVISPTLARKINESSSDSEHFDDCLMINENTDLNVEQLELQDIEIIECLNSMVEKVCSDLERCADILKRDSNAIVDIANSITVEDPIDNIPIRDLSNFENVIANKADTAEPKDNLAKTKKSIKLKYAPKKNAQLRKKKKTKLQLESTYKSPIEKKTNIVDAQNKLKTPEKSEVVNSPKSDSPASKSMNSDTRLTRRKRKLYSPKYESIESELSAELDNENPYFKSSKIQTPKYTSTCYKDIEKERQKRIRKLRTGKSKPESETPSPRTKKMNDVFDQLKEKVECSENFILADKKSLQNDLAVYNFTSDSEDEDFKIKKIEVQKRISSTTIASANSVSSTRPGRSAKCLNYSETVSSDDVNKKNVSKQKKTVKRKTPRKRVTKRQNNLIDERMRDAVSDKLSTSIVEKPRKDISEEPVLKLDEKPQMEAIPDETVIEAESNIKPKKQKKKQNKTDGLSLRKEKNLNVNKLIVERDNDDRTSSPLPGLVVEAMPTRSEDHNDSVSANMLQKFQKIYQDGPEEFINETNTTQNLLSDVERINYSPVQMNITDELNKFDIRNDDLNVQEDSTNDTSKSSKSKQKVLVIELEPIPSKLLRVKKEKADSMRRKIKNDTELEKEVINLSTTSDAKSEKSIATVGKSPITAHGDFDEDPPDFELLTEKFKPRDLETQDLNQSLKEYYNKLRDEVSNVPADDRSNSIVSDSTRIIQRLDRSDSKSPTVSLKRLTFDDFSKWLPSRRNSETDSSSSKKTVKDNRQEISSEKCSSNLNKKSSKKGSTSDQEADGTHRAIQKIEEISLEFNNVVTTRSKVKRGKKTNKNQSKPADFDELNEIVDEETINKTSRGKKLKKSKNIISPKISSNEANTKWLRSHSDTNPVNSSQEVVEKNISHSKKAKKTIDSNVPQVTRQSMISPIKLFDDVFPNKMRSSESRDRSSIVRQESFDDRQESSSKKQESSTIRQQSTIFRQESSNIRALSNDVGQSSSEEDNNNEIWTIISKSKKNNNLDLIEKISKLKKGKENVEVSLADSNKSMSEKSTPKISTPKRKSDSPANVDSKRRKLDRQLEKMVVASEIVPSASSVNEWFRRNAPVSSAESITASFHESIQNVMEKLDTTLLEIHQNTSKKFVHMFVDVQKHLVEVKRQRREMYKSVASDILGQVVKVIDDKFADLDKRSQELDVQMMEQLKAAAAELLRADCARKQALLALLREDLRATAAQGPNH